MHKVEDVSVRNISRNVFQYDEKLTYLVGNCNYIKPCVLTMNMTHGHSERLKGLHESDSTFSKLFGEEY
jgi:hypothetical protein